ncbi:MAG: putative lipid II flippase FtsW [Ktedonobacteraceae bacterium]|nr:putative lipid II flippase FtsW [Ktedonobacteraceae bacterium]MBO0790626.1 putative lipid II flippase FtsW [Ktedonobacteraceae bacterium]
MRNRLRNRRNGDGKRRLKGGSLPSLRSPALESAERQSRLHSENGGGRSQSSGHIPAVRGQMSYANEDQLAHPFRARKSLPPLRRKLSNEAAVQPTPRTGLTASWKRARQVTNPASEPVQVISDEEQKKLEALEMQLPRVAGKIDSMLLIAVLALVCIGLVMVYSASSFIAARYYGDASYYFQRQLMWAVFGITAMLVTMRIDYRHWRRFSLAGLVVTLPLLVLVLIFGTSAYGASRWFTFGNFVSIQPSEIAKLVLALYIADWLARKGNQVGTFLYGLAPFVILVGIVLGLVLLENDMGTAVIIACLATAMFFTAGANILQFLLAAGCGGLIFLTQAFQGYRYLRLMGFLDPFSDVTGKNLQLYQSLLALGSGGWLGLGLGASRQKTGYLPLPYIDSIFAIIGEELGFIGCAVIVLLFAFLAFRGFRLARRSQDVYGALLSTGITTWLVMQALINIGAATGSIPYTGVPLPFITFGGSSLVISLAAVGVLLNISRYIQEPELPALSKRSITMTLKKRRA